VSGPRSQHSVEREVASRTLGERWISRTTNHRGESIFTVLNFVVGNVADA
jgi:hypothetical protein